MSAWHDHTPRMDAAKRGLFLSNHPDNQYVAKNISLQVSREALVVFSVKMTIIWLTEANSNRPGAL